MKSDQHRPPIAPAGLSYIEFDEIDFDSRPVILDVRKLAEQRSVIGYLRGSMNIPLGVLPSSLYRIEPVKNDEIILVCLTGDHSYMAAQILIQAGFTNVKVLKGGLSEVSTPQFNIKLKKPDG